MMQRTIVIFLLFVTSNCFSQPIFENVYKRTAGGSQQIGAFEGTQNGCYYAIGSDGNNVTSIVKIDSSGNHIWDRNFSDSTGQVYIHTIKSMPDGGFAAAGGCNSGFLLMRGDSMGNVVWSRVYHYFFTSEAFSTIVMTPDQGFILSGNYWHNAQPFLVRVDSIGNVIYLKTFTENFNLTLIYKLQPSSDGNYFALFSSADYPRARVMKFDVDGNQIWSVGVGDTSASAIVMSTSAICMSTDGGCIVGGTLLDGPFTHQAMAICKINSMAGVDWIRIATSNTATYYGAYAVINTFDNGLMVGSGLYDTSGTFLNEFHLTKTDSLGHFLWTKKNSSIFSVIDIKEKRDHGFTMASNVYIPQSQILIFNTDSFANAPCDGSSMNVVDSTITLPLFTPHYTVSDHSMTQDTIILAADSGMIVLDYCQLLSVPVEKKNSNISVFPNPFQTEARFNSQSAVENAQLKIYNILGVMVHEEKILNLNSYILHRNNLNDGLYFYEVTDSDHQLIGNGKFVIE